LDNVILQADVGDQIPQATGLDIRSNVKIEFEGTRVDKRFDAVLFSLAMAKGPAGLGRLS
jgi:hypothetical protein